MARDFDLVWELEALCIENVRPWLHDVCSRGFLFFNLESHFIQQLQQRGTDVFDPFFECHHQVVIEVTERSAIRDYRTFRRTLHDLKEMGFRIAIDDCGSGYATLEAVAELQPDYLKVGHSLFHDVETDPIRRRLVELVARCADTIGARHHRRGDRDRGAAPRLPRPRHPPRAGLLLRRRRARGTRSRRGNRNVGRASARRPRAG